MKSDVYRDIKIYHDGDVNLSSCDTLPSYVYVWVLLLEFPGSSSTPLIFNDQPTKRECRWNDLSFVGKLLMFTDFSRACGIHFIIFNNDNIKCVNNFITNFQISGLLEYNPVDHGRTSLLQGSWYFILDVSKNVQFLGKLNFWVIEFFVFSLIYFEKKW